MLTDTLGKVVLAVIQGLTEIFPVSSSAHLVIYGAVLGQQLTLNQIIFFHLGSFLSILFFYRTDIAQLVRSKEGWKLAGFLLVSFAVTALVGSIVKEAIVDLLVTEPHQVALLWIANGLIMIGLACLLDARKEPGLRKMSELSLYEWVIVGMIQGFTALPGISRLGMTLAVGLLRRLTWSEALKLSFLLALPTILGANLYPLVRSIVTTGSLRIPASPAPIMALPDTLLVLITMLCGLSALYFLSKVIFLGRRLLVFFGLYCLVAGCFFSFYLDLL